MSSWVKPMAPIDWCERVAIRCANSDAWLLAAAIEKLPPVSSPPSSASRAAVSAEAIAAATAGRFASQQRNTPPLTARAAGRSALDEGQEGGVSPVLPIGAHAGRG